MKRSLLPAAVLAVLFLCVATLPATDYYVSVTGTDDAATDGLTPATAWAGLAYACTRIEPGPHTIHLGEGTFVATQTAYLKSGFRVIGAGAELTTLAGDSLWLMQGRRNQFKRPNYLIAGDNLDSVRVAGMRLISQNRDSLLDGAIRFERVKHSELDSLHLEDFAWAGAYLRLCKFMQVHDNVFLNASTEKDGYWGGCLFTRYFEQSEIYNNTITTTYGGGYGYKASGHRSTSFHDNTVIPNNGNFAIESAHENEYDFEIYDNYLDGTISVPKPGQGANPLNEGYTNSVWIHDNIITHSYTVEGPRNHLRLEHNYIDIEMSDDNDNGRVYTHHGGINFGPVYIHNNVIVNVDRAFIWKNEGRADSIHAYNNTVYCADSPRAGDLLGIANGQGLRGWTFHNNLVIAPDSQPRKFYRQNVGGDTAITATHNLLVNVTFAPPGNFTAEDPGLTGSGDRPFPYYAPLSEQSFVVDQGLDVGLPFIGTAPDIGAFEFDPQALPVTWEQVTAERHGGGRVMVYWTTGREASNEHFDIQRRTATHPWETIGSVAGGGTQTGRSNYTWLDEAAPAAKTYYRLVQVDFDGSRHNSIIVAVAALPAAPPRLWPNPARSAAFLLDPPAAAREVQLFDAAGRLVRTLALPLTAGKIPVADLPPGYYRVVVGEVSLPLLVGGK